MLKLVELSEDTNELQRDVIRMGRECYFLCMDIRSAGLDELSDISRSALDSFLDRDRKLIEDFCDECIKDGKSVNDALRSPRFPMIYNEYEIAEMIMEKFDERTDNT